MCRGPQTTDHGCQASDAMLSSRCRALHGSVPILTPVGYTSPSSEALAMDGKIADEQMRDSDIFVAGISSPSGGGKTAVAMRVSELLPDAVTISFNDYDFDTVHPASFRRWLEEGANFNDWKSQAAKTQATRRPDEAGKLTLQTPGGSTWPSRIQSDSSITSRCH